MAKSMVQGVHFDEPIYRKTAIGLDRQLGFFAAFATLCIWASWLVSVKLGSYSSLTSFDLALMRFGVPCLLFAPMVWRGRHLIYAVPKRYLLGILVGAGVPFFYLSSAGMHYAPVSHAGLLIPGTSPLFVTAIAVLVFKEALSRQRLMGLVLIALGVIGLIVISAWQGLSESTMLGQAANEVWKGDLLLLSAGFCWAVFTICLRVAGLPPLLATGLLGLGSSIALLMLLALGWVDSGLFQNDSAQLSLWTLGSQFIVQGILVGVVTGFTYGFAIHRIGAESTAALGSLTPVLATLAAMPLLAESVSMAAILGSLFICFGVFFASGVKLRVTSIVKLKASE